MTESFEIQTARSYAVVGLIFYILGAVGFIFLLAVIGFIPWVNTSSINSVSTPNIGLFGLILFGVPLSITFGFSVWSWITLDNIKKGKYIEARTSSLVLGIFGLMFAWVIGGIFLLLAYSKLGDAIKEIHVTNASTNYEEKKCDTCGKQIALNTLFCEHCGNKINK
ncbi:zinc ribbon domain-containing protein [Thermoproteota archaeon]